MFGDYIRDLRETTGKSQGEVAIDAGVSQTLLSYWETGKRLPEVTSSTILKNLAKALNEDYNALRDFLSEEVLGSNPQITRTLAPRVGLNFPQYLSVLDEYIPNIAGGHDNIDLWIMGATGKLPVLQHAFVQDSWVRNVSRGTCYYIIWFLDLINSHTVLDQMASAMYNLDERIQSECLKIHQGNDTMKLPIEPRGKIVHIAASTQGEMKADPECVNRYIEIQKEMEKLKGEGEIKWNQFLEPKEYPDLQPTLLRYFSPLGTLLLYDPKGKFRQPLLSIGLQEARSSFEGDSYPVWFLLSNETAVELRNELRKLKAAIQS